VGWELGLGLGLGLGYRVKVELEHRAIEIPLLQTMLVVVVVDDCFYMIYIYTKLYTISLFCNILYYVGASV
jgi:hypothetical protein